MMRFRFPIVGDADLAAADALRADLAAFTSVAVGSPVVIDCAGLSFIDATGIGVLVEAHQRLTRDGRRLMLDGISPRIERVLVVSGLAGEFAAPANVALRQPVAAGAATPHRRPPDRSKLHRLLDHALAATRTDRGAIHVADELTVGGRGGLSIEVHRGLGDLFLAFFSFVDDDHPAQVEILRTGRLIIDDVTRSPLLAGTLSLDVLLHTGVRAVHSTAVRTPDGDVIGVVSTHFREPHRPDHEERAALDGLARRVAPVLIDL